MVVLLGDDADENTIEAPEGVTAGALDRRVPEHALLPRSPRASRSGRARAGPGPARRHDAQLPPQRHRAGGLTSTEQSDCVRRRSPLTGRHRAWWILKDEPARATPGDMFASSGHMAALYHDELYEMATGRAASRGCSCSA